MKELSERSEKELEKEKKKETKKVERFGFEEAHKIIIKLKKIFPLAENPEREDCLLLDNNKSVVDPSNVALVFGKNEKSKRILSYFIEVDEKLKDIPKIEYNEGGKGRFSLEYLKPFIDVLGVTDDAISIQVKKEFPITIENKDFVFIIAPRIENE
jgi:phage anti-repressor protein